MDFQLPETIITDEVVENARQQANDAWARFNALQRRQKEQRRERQRNGESVEPKWIDTRLVSQERKEQAQVRVIYIGFDGEWRNTVRDFYPLDGGVVWELRWVCSSMQTSAERRQRVFDSVKDLHGVGDKSTCMVEVPCVCDDCPHTTTQNVHDVETLAEKTEMIFNIETGRCDKAIIHEVIDEFVCSTCKGENRLLNKWEQLCPAVFREGRDKTDRRFFPPKTWQAMVEWGQSVKTSTRSLYVYGDTGVGKSRMMFELLKDFVVGNGFSFKVYAGGEFRREQELIMATRFDKNARFVSEAETVDVLVFDDLGQDDLNGSMRSNLRWLIDKRLTNGMRTIFLANVAPTQLHLSYGEGISISTLTRRLLDYCDVVEVKTTKTMLDNSIKRGRERLALESVTVEDIPPDESPF